MNTAQFFIEQLGKENDSGSFKGQCVNLIHSYYEEVLGIPRFVGNAKDYVNETRIPKVSGKPQPGDIVVFNYGTDGHIGLCVWGREQDFECMEQNNPTNSPCHYVYHTDFQNIIGILRPNLPENTTPRPDQVGKVTNVVFTMQYIAINSDPSLLEQARQLLVQYSDGRIDCSFQYSYIPEIMAPLLWTTEDQQAFLKIHPIATPFCYLTYANNDPGHYDATTHTVAGSQVYLTAAQGPIPVMSVAFEMMHGLQYYILDKGFPIGLPLDNFNATEELVQAKVDKVLPYLSSLG